MTDKIRVLILEDHQSIIDGYLFRLGGEQDLEIAAVSCASSRSSRSRAIRWT